MEKNKTFVFFIFMIIIFYAVPAVFTLLLYCGVLTRNFYLSVEDTVFETYKNCAVIIPEPGFAIYFVLIGAGAFLLGAVSKKRAECISCVYNNGCCGNTTGVGSQICGRGHGDNICADDRYPDGNMCFNGIFRI